MCFLDKEILDVDALRWDMHFAALISRLCRMSFNTSTLLRYIHDEFLFTFVGIARTK